MSYNELYLINSGISGRERDKEKERQREGERERGRERDEFCVINVKHKEISWRVKKKKEEK